MISTQTLMVANACNLSCTYCWYETGAVPYKDATLTPEVYEAWLARCAGLQPLASVDLTGGEPLLREDLPEIAAAAKRHAARVAIFSNGMLLTDELAARLGGIGCEIHVSLDHLSQNLADTVRGGTPATLRALHKLRETAGTLPVQICVVVTARNYRELDPIADFARESGFRLELIPIAVPDVHPLSLASIAQAEREELAAGLARLHDVTGRPLYYRRLASVLRTGKLPHVSTCAIGTQGVFVDSDGEVRICAQRTGVSLGNIADLDPAAVVERKRRELAARAAGPCVSLDCLVVA